MSPIEKTEEVALVLVESEDMARGDQILSALGALTENPKIMGMVHISHFTNQETITEALSLVIGSERTGVEPGPANTGMHSPVLMVTWRKVLLPTIHTWPAPRRRDTKTEP